MTTMKAAHTPGPWRSHDHRDKRHREYAIMAGEGEGAVKVASCHTHHVPWDVAAVNSHLIAAAPETAAERDRLKEINAELLAALKDLLGDRRNDENGRCLHCGRDNRGYDLEPCSDDCPGQVARAAIARATVTP